MQAILRAVERGINWIDTAPAYGLGKAEEVVGTALRRMPSHLRPLMFTKCGLVWEQGARTVSNVLAPASIRSECEQSLRRLGVEVLDLLQIHWPSDDGTPIEDSWATMRELVDEGKVRCIGVSNFGVDLLDACEGIRHVDTVQPQLNLLVRDALDSVIPWARRHRAGVLVYSPMRSGLLSGSFTHERAASLPDDDWRRADGDFTEPLLSRHLDLVDRLRPVAGDLDCTVAELAIAWTLHQPGVTAAIVGARRPEQVDGWIGSLDVSLSPDAVSAIESALEASGMTEPAPAR